MKVNINQYIVNQLEKVGSVSLPQIGSFTLERVGAQMGQNRLLISSPSFNINYSEISKEVDSLVQYIAKMEHLSLEDSSLLFNKYVLRLTAHLEEKGDVYIHQLGKVSREDSQLVFEQDKNSVFSNINFALPQVKLSPIVREKKEKIALIEKLQNIDAPIQKINKTKSIPQVIEPMKPVIASSLSASSPSSSSSKNNWKDWLIAALIAMLLICMYKSCSSDPIGVQPDGYISKVDSLQKVEDSLITSFDSTNLDQEEDTVRVVEDEVIEEAVPMRCIIITGSFKKSRLALKMKSKIINNGYEVFMERSGEYNRVGITFDCTGIDLESYIRRVRTEFDIHAWYLEPDLEVSR